MSSWAWQPLLPATAQQQAGGGGGPTEYYPAHLLRRADARRDTTSRRLVTLPILHLTQTVSASTDAKLADPFTTRVTRSRRQLAVGWMAGLAAQQQAAVIPYPSWSRPVTVRRKATERRLIEAPALHWQYIAPTIAAILVKPTAKVIEFRRTIQIQQPLALYPPPTGPPTYYPGWAARTVKRVSQDRQLQPQASQASYPATPPTLSSDATLVDGFVTRVYRSRRLQQALIPPVYPVATPPSGDAGIIAASTPYRPRRRPSRHGVVFVDTLIVSEYQPQPHYPVAALFPAKAIRRRVTDYGFIAVDVAVTATAAPDTTPAPSAYAAKKALKRRNTERRLQQVPPAPSYPATPAVQFQFAAVAPARARRRKSAGGGIVVVTTVFGPPTTGGTTPAVYPSHLQIGFHQRRTTERRLLLAPPVADPPETPAGQASTDASLVSPFETRRTRSRRSLSQGWIAALTTPTPPPAPATVAAYTPVKVIRRRDIERGFVLVTVTEVIRSTATYPSFVPVGFHRRQETDRRHLKALDAPSKPQTPPTPPQPYSAWKLATAARIEQIRRLQPQFALLEHPETPPVVVVPPQGGDDKPDSKHKHPGWDKKRAKLKLTQEQELAAEIRRLYRKLTDTEETRPAAEAIVAEIVAPTIQLADDATQRTEQLRQSLALIAAQLAIEKEIALRLLYEELLARELEEDDMEAIQIIMGLI